MKAKSMGFMVKAYLQMLAGSFAALMLVLFLPEKPSFLFGVLLALFLLSLLNLAFVAIGGMTIAGGNIFSLLLWPALKLFGRDPRRMLATQLPDWLVMALQACLVVITASIMAWKVPDMSRAELAAAALLAWILTGALWLRMRKIKAQKDADEEQERLKQPHQEIEKADIKGSAEWSDTDGPGLPGTLHVAAAAPSTALSPLAPESSPIDTQQQQADAPEPLAMQEELRAALRGIGLMRIEGASWQEAASEERWANLRVYLHFERDKLDSCPDDVDGLYLTLEEAEAAVAASPRGEDSRVWKVFATAVKIAYVIDDRRALPHLVSAIKRELLTLPACPGTCVKLEGSYKDDKIAWLDASGQNIVLFEDEDALKDESVFGKKHKQTGAFKTDVGMGLFDDTGTVIVLPIFEEVGCFYGDLAAARLHGQWGFIDRNSQWKIEPQYIELGSCSFYIDDWAYVRTKEGWGVIDRLGREILKPAWDSVEPGPDKSFRVMLDGRCGYVKAAGVCVAGFQVEPYWLDFFLNTLPAEALILRHPYSWVHLYALADGNGRRLTEFDFDWLLPPREGLLAAKLKQEDGIATHIGFIDSTGAWVISPRFETAYYFSEGMAKIANVDHQWGYCNRQGDIVIDYQFTDAESFSEGLAGVRVGEYPDRHYGFIDANGKWVIQPQFDNVGKFSQGLAKAELNGLWGYIGRDGSWAIAPAFSWAGSFSESGYACVSISTGSNERFGIIDRAGQWLVQPSYEGIVDARQVDCGTAGLQWVAAVRDANDCWGGVMLSLDEAERKIIVPFECGSSGAVYRTLEHN